MVRPCVAREFRRYGDSGLASMYPAFWLERLAPGHHGYQRGCDLISGKASKAIWVTSIRTRREDLVLQRENVVERAVEFFRPKMMAGFGVDKLRGDAQTIADLSYAAFDDIPGRKFAPDFSDVVRLLFECKAGVTCNYRKRTPCRK